MDPTPGTGTHHQSLEAARMAARRWLANHHSDCDPESICESVLLKEQRISGHQFAWRGVTIRWLVGRPELWIQQDGQAPFAIDRDQAGAEQKAA